MKSTILVTLLMWAAGATAAEIGTAGCGLGNMLMGGKDSQILVATVNGTGTQTFGITSGTSNCVDNSGVAKLEVYVEANRLALANDMARGRGDTLSGLNHVLGCSKESDVNSTLQQNYGEIFSRGNSVQGISNEIRKVLKTQPAGHSCARLS